MGDLIDYSNAYLKGTIVDVRRKLNDLELRCEMYHQNLQAAEAELAKREKERDI